MTEDGTGLNEFLSEVANKQRNVMTVAKDLLDGKEHVTVTLAHEKVMPVRMESPARHHEFYDADGFIKYLIAGKTDNTVVLADVNEATVHAVLDDDAKQGFEVVTLAPPYHPQFVLLRETLLGAMMEIMEFATDVLRNQAVIIGVDGSRFGEDENVRKQEARNLAMLMQQITVSSKVTTHKGTGSHSINGVVCEMEVKSGVDAIGENIELPRSIMVKLPIYLNTEPVEFDIDITVKPASQERVLVVTDAPEVNVRKFEVFEKILEPIKGEKGLLVSYGKPGFANWQYNR